MNKVITHDLDPIRTSYNYIFQTLIYEYFSSLICEEEKNDLMIKKSKPHLLLRKWKENTQILFLCILNVFFKFWIIDS